MTMRAHTPDFMIIGAMKAGTTGLYRALQQHPGIAMTSMKEPNYFCSPEWFSGAWERGPAWYERLFSPGDAVRGEASTAYTKLPADPGVCERIYMTNPEVKLIYLVRDPVARAMSHYFHNLLSDTEELSMHEALLSTKPRGYVSATMYHKQLQRYYQRFPTKNICVLAAEDLWSRSATVLERVAEHIGVSSEPMARIQIVRANETQERARKFLTKAIVTRSESGHRLEGYLRAREDLENLGSLELGEVLGFSSSDRDLLRERFVTDQSLLQACIGSLEPA